MENALSWPKISIVTPNFNYGRFIEKTIRSVLLQGYPNLEYIVIDGGSTDESVEVIKKYEPWIAYWESEKDQGQTHAINKGFTHASGDIVAYINSDDIYLPGAFQRVAEAFHDAPDRIYVGDVEVVRQVGDDEAAPTLVKAEDLTLRRIIDPDDRSPSIKQPGIFAPMQIHRRSGGDLNVSLYYNMDLEWLLRLLRIASVQYLHARVAREYAHSEAKTGAITPEFLNEQFAVLQAFNDASIGVPPSHLKAELYLRMAGLHLVQHAKCFDQWSRSKGMASLIRAFLTRPLIVLKYPRLYFGLLARSLMPMGPDFYLK